MLGERFFLPLRRCGCHWALRQAERSEGSPYPPIQEYGFPCFRRHLQDFPSPLHAGLFTGRACQGWRGRASPYWRQFPRLSHCRRGCWAQSELFLAQVSSAFRHMSYSRSRFGRKKSPPEIRVQARCVSSTSGCESSVWILAKENAAPIFE